MQSRFSRTSRRARASAPVAAAVLACVLGTAIIGCGSGPRSSRPERRLNNDAARDADRARTENEAALELLARNMVQEAVARLRAAVAADPSFGAAHNNLGQVYFTQRDLYRAAVEFQLAARLLPDRPEPANNLGLVFEAAGKLDEAADGYAKAVALAPDDPQFLGNLARARVRRGQRADPETRRLLERLVLVETRPAWLEWSRRQLALNGSTQPADAAP